MHKSTYYKYARLISDIIIVTTKSHTMPSITAFLGMHDK